MLYLNNKNVLEKFVNCSFINRDKIIILLFLSPSAKERIRNQLEAIGFGYETMFPEIDTVFHEVSKLRRNIENNQNKDG